MDYVMEPKTKGGDQSEKVTVGIIRCGSVFSVFVPGTEIVIDILNNSGRRRDFVMYFKKQKPRKYHFECKINKLALNLGNLAVLARNITKLLAREVFNIPFSLKMITG